MVGHKVSFSTAHAGGTDCISMMNTQMAVPRGHLMTFIRKLYPWLMYGSA
jgi:hypothetical protein